MPRVRTAWRLTAFGLWMALVAAVTGCARPAPAPQNPQLADQYSAIRSIAILPPHVEVYSVATGGAKEHLADAEAQVAKELVDSAVQQLASRSRDGKPVQLSEAKSGGELFHAVWIQNSYNFISTEFGRQPFASDGHLTGARFGDGDDAVELSRELATDGVLFLACSAEQRTGGSVGTELATKMLIGVATAGLLVPAAEPAGRIVLEAALVDGTTGHVVWAGSGADFKMALMGSSFDPKIVEGVAKTAFQTLPK
jgi:hypothetical protein